MGGNIMQNKFKLEINDFGPIESANININQINIIGGPNSSGKSFSSKLLFCFLTSLSEHGKHIENQGIYGSFDSFIKRWVNNTPNSSLNTISYNYAELHDKINKLMSEWDENNIEYGYLYDFFMKFKNILSEYDLLDDDECNNDLNLVKENVDFNRSKFNYVNRVIQYLLFVEFGQKSLKLFKGSKIEFSEYSNKLFNFLLEFDDNFVDLKFNVEDNLKIDLNKVIYIDSLSLLDFGIKFNEGVEVKSNLGQFHFYALLEGLIQKQDDRDIALKKLYAQYSKDYANELESIMNGSFRFDDEDNVFIFDSDIGPIELKNVASGYKQLGMLQLLLSNNYISEGTWLIIDEPEINLHPSMQVKLAKILIKMANELNIKIYINSHSPYIIEAIEVYSKKEKMEDKTSFFLCEQSNNFKFKINEINRNDLVKIYDTLANPYNTINSVRFENDWNEEFD